MEVIHVDFAPEKPEAADEPLMRVQQRDIMACKHLPILISEDLRRVTCKECGEQLDPIEVLLFWSRNWERYANSVKWCADEHKRLAAEVTDLKRQRANLRAQIRRAALPLATHEGV